MFQVVILTNMVTPILEQILCMAAKINVCNNCNIMIHRQKTVHYLLTIDTSDYSGSETEVSQGNLTSYIWVVLVS